MNRFQANLCLISVTLCWASGTIFYKNIPSELNPFCVTTLTNLVGLLILGIVFFRRLDLRVVNKRFLLRMLLLGIINTLVNAMLVWGLQRVSVISGAFMQSACTAVIMPLLLLLIGRKTTPANWLGAAIILAGILLGLPLGNAGEESVGLLVMLAASVTWAIYIVLLNKTAKEYPPLLVAVMLMAMVTVISFLCWTAFEPTTFFAIEYSGQMIAAIFIYSYFVCAFATSVNVLAHRQAAPQTAAAIYALEVVFTVILAAVLPPILVSRIPISPASLAGCALVTVGAIIADLDLKQLIRQLRSKREGARHV